MKTTERDPGWRGDLEGHSKNIFYNELDLLFLVFFQDLYLINCYNGRRSGKTPVAQSENN